MRTALARDVSAWFESPTTLGDALAGYALSHHIKLVPSETAKLVRDTELEADYERSAKALDKEGIARIQDSVNRMVSILEDGPGARDFWN